MRYLIFKILLVHTKHALVCAWLFILTGELYGVKFRTLESMELLETHKALNARSFGFASIAVVRRFVYEVFKHGAYIDPFFERRFE